MTALSSLDTWSSARVETYPLATDLNTIITRVNAHEAGTIGLKRPVYAAATILTADDCGAMCYFNAAAGLLYTLPDAVVGLWYDFAVTVTATSLVHRIVCDTGDFLAGTILQGQPTTFTQTARTGNGSSHLAWEGNGTTKGGIIGDVMKFVCATAGVWTVSGVNTATGSTASPFVTS